MTARELELLQGTLDVLVLRALSWGPKHGYAVARFIRDGSNHAFQILDGALYTSLHRMEEKGWVERRAHETDRRTKVVHLTKEGKKLITRVYSDHAADLERLASAALTRKERATLIRLLKQIGYEAAEKVSHRLNG